MYKRQDQRSEDVPDRAARDEVEPDAVELLGDDHADVYKRQNCYRHQQIFENFHVFSFQTGIVRFCRKRTAPHCGGQT